METIMMSISTTEKCEIILPIIIALGTSLLCWLVGNVLLLPNLNIDDKIQHGKNNRKYLRVANKHWLMNAYNVECYVEYYRPKDAVQPYYMVSHDPKPILRCKGPYLTFYINTDKAAKECFKQQGKIKVIVSYQNCFGIKHNTQSQFIPLIDVG